MKILLLIGMLTLSDKPTFIGQAYPQESMEQCQQIIQNKILQDSYKGMSLICVETR